MARSLVDLTAVHIVIEPSNVVILAEERAKRAVKAAVTELLDALATERLRNG